MPPTTHVELFRAIRPALREVSRDLRSADALVYFVLVSYYHLGKRRAWPSASRIADHLDFSETKVERCLSRLEGLGLIRDVEEGGYRLIFSSSSPKPRRTGFLR